MSPNFPFFVKGTAKWFHTPGSLDWSHRYDKTELRIVPASWYNQRGVAVYIKYGKLVKKLDDEDNYHPFFRGDYDPVGTAHITFRNKKEAIEFVRQYLIRHEKKIITDEMQQ